MSTVWEDGKEERRGNQGKLEALHGNGMERRVAGTQV